MLLLWVYGCLMTCKNICQDMLLISSTWLQLPCVCCRLMIWDVKYRSKKTKVVKNAYKNAAFQGNSS